MILIDVSLILADSTMKNLFFPETAVFFGGGKLSGAGWASWLAGLTGWPVCSLAGCWLAGWRLDGWSAGVAQPAPESFLKK